MTAAEWNAKYPVGMSVAYFPVKGRMEHTDTKTRSEAWELGGGQAVVLVDDRAGGVAISHLLVDKKMECYPAFAEIPKYLRVQPGI
jgi:hypothetical protein